MNWKIAALLIVAIAAGCKDRSADDGSGDAPTAEPAKDDRGVILFLGTSLTAGYGVGAENAFPAIIQQKIDSAGMPYRVVNAGISGETSAGGLRRIDWALQQPVSILVLELGANDALRGLDPDSMKANLAEIINKTREKYPQASIVIAGMEAPPNLGREYTSRFSRAFRDLVNENDAAFIPFLLAGVAARPELNQADGIHPTLQGQRIMADSVWLYLEPVLRTSSGERKP